MLTTWSGLTERKMFGGLCMMLGEHTCCGVIKDELMVRVGADKHAELSTEPHVRPVDFTGRPMRGMLYVSTEGCSHDDQLTLWVNRAAAYAASLPPKK